MDDYVGKMEQLLIRTKSKVKRRLKQQHQHHHQHHQSNPPTITTSSVASGSSVGSPATLSPRSPTLSPFRQNRPLPPTPVAPGITFGATLPLLASLDDVTSALQETWCFEDFIPKVVADCIQYLSSDPTCTAFFFPSFSHLFLFFILMNNEIDLRTEGLFRISASLNDVKALKTAYQSASSVSPILPPDEPHLIANVLKAYLRELAEPLLTFELYDVFIAANGICLPEPRLACIKRVLTMLPALHAALLAALVRFLRHVSTFAEENKMTAANLATVFAPNLLRAETETPVMLLTESKDAAQMLQTMIEEADFLFDGQLQSTLPESQEFSSSSQDLAQNINSSDAPQKEDSISDAKIESITMLKKANVELNDDILPSSEPIDDNESVVTAKSPSLFVEASEHLPSDTRSIQSFQLEKKDDDDE